LLQFLKLRTPDQSLSFEVKPLAQGLEVTLEGFGWNPAQGSPFLFDSVNLNGTIENGAFTIRSMELRLFDGLIQGEAVLRGDKQPSISGEIVFERVNTSRLGNAMGFGEKFSGGISGKLRFSSTADSWATIFSAINAEGDVTVRRGSIRGIDLAEAVRRVSNMSVQGGATQFEQLSGSVNFTPTSYQFNGLVLDSGLMRSTGQIEVSKNLEIRGKMVLQMRGTANQTRVPVTIGGHLNAPELQVVKN
jgi:AsmA protein